MTDDTGTMERKAQVFLEKEIPVHISDKGGSWFNGVIKEVGADFLILEEFKLGRQVIFFAEVSKFETYTREVNNE
jgi:hypothetical protein|tara:strand:+ start:684 stop:908 length:225 start_codon:yes stop_codon:yes gene_type:complete